MRKWWVVLDEKGRTARICMHYVGTNKAVIYAMSPLEYEDMQADYSLLWHVVELMVDFKHVE